MLFEPHNFLEVTIHKEKYFLKLIVNLTSQ